ncbi:prolipoprotein diacylglyceryl transferase, partial [Sphaerisporangium sp. TRM90804]|uniref:prolipoprotein diacylglyceryl transferase n=1 Tax=Sphaerisporangium sp. TRM90804 TaxID=3031113 RepID=UPI00244CE7F5
MPLALIPSPSEGVWHLGPIPLRAYAFCIVLGIIAAVWIGERRWRARGGEPGTITDLAVWAVPFGLVGGRLYHVITDWQLYFGPDAPNRPIDVLYVWHGGLGIWGAIALGAVGVWIACRRRGISLSAVADTVAPGIAVAQAIGRWGNYFNQELFGGPTTLPWGLEIDPGRPGTVPGVATYHPTFLYESLWNLVLAGVLIWVGSRYALRHGRLFAVYVAGYSIGRFWIEGMRVDPAHEILGMRLNQWTSLAILVGALVYLWLTRDKDTEEFVAPQLGAGTADPAHQAEQADAEESAAAAAWQAAPGDDETAASPAQKLSVDAPGDGSPGDDTPSTAAPAVAAVPAVAVADASPADPAHQADQADASEGASVREPVLGSGEGVDPAHQAGQADPSEGGLVQEPV